MKIRIERPAEKVCRDVRVFLDDIEVSRSTNAVSLDMKVGEPSYVTLRLLGEVEINTYGLAEWEARRQA